MPMAKQTLLLEIRLLSITLEQQMILKSGFKQIGILSVVRGVWLQYLVKVAMISMSAQPTLKKSNQKASAFV